MIEKRTWYSEAHAYCFQASVYGLKAMFRWGNACQSSFVSFRRICTETRVDCNRPLDSAVGPDRLSVEGRLD